MSVLRFQNTKIKACAAGVPESSTVDYSSGTSVFPAEACEIAGGKACNVEMYPEVKLKSEGNSINKSSSTESEPFDREYLEYNSPKTVFLEEACDDLGGEFCEPEFLKELTS